MKKNKPFMNIIGIAASLVLIIAPVVATVSIISSKNDKNTGETDKPGTNDTKLDWKPVVIEKDVRNDFKREIIKSWNAITPLKNQDKQKLLEDKINNLSAEIAYSLDMKVKTVIDAFDTILSEHQLADVAKMYTTVASTLNKQLVTILNSVVTALNNENEIQDPLQFVKDELNAEVLTSIKQTVINVLIGDEHRVELFAETIFNSLKENEKTKNIAVLDAFIKGMTEFYKAYIPNMKKEINEIKFDNVGQTGLYDQINKMQNVLEKFKTDSRAKAKELLKDEKDYNTIKEVLYPKFKVLFNVALESKTFLIEKTKDLVKIIGDILAK